VTKKLQEAEDELVRLSGIDKDQFHSYPVKFTFNESDWKEELKEDIARDQTNAWS